MTTTLQSNHTIPAAAAAAAAAPWVEIVSYLSSPRDVASIALSNHETNAVLTEAGDYVRKKLAENRYGPALAREAVTRHYGGDHASMLRDDNRRGTWLNLPLPRNEPLFDSRSETGTQAQESQPQPQSQSSPHPQNRLEVVAVRYQRDHRILRVYLRGHNALPDTVEAGNSTPKGPAFRLVRLDRDDPEIRNLLFVFCFHKREDVYHYKGVGRSFQEVPAPPAPTGDSRDDGNDNGNDYDDKASCRKLEARKCRVLEFELSYCLDRICNHPLDLVLCLEHNEFRLVSIPAGGTVEDAFRVDSDDASRDRDSYAPYEGSDARDAVPTLAMQKQLYIGRHRVQEVLRRHGWEVL